MIGLLPIALIACMSFGPTVADEAAAVPLGVDLGRSAPSQLALNRRLPQAQHSPPRAMRPTRST